MKKKIIDFFELTEKDIKEIKVGYKSILKGFTYFLMIGIPTITISFIAHYFGFFHWLAGGILLIIILFFIIVAITAWAQSIGQDKLAEREVHTFEKSDGTKGTYTVIKKG